MGTPIRCGFGYLPEVHCFLEYSEGDSATISEYATSIRFAHMCRSFLLRGNGVPCYIVITSWVSTAKQFFPSHRERRNPFFLPNL